MNELYVVVQYDTDDTSGPCPIVTGIYETQEEAFEGAWESFYEWMISIHTESVYIPKSIEELKEHIESNDGRLICFNEEMIHYE